MLKLLTSNPPVLTSSEEALILRHFRQLIRFLTQYHRVHSAQQQSSWWVLMTERGIRCTRAATVGVVNLVHNKAAALMCRDSEASVEILGLFLFYIKIQFVVFSTYPEEVGSGLQNITSKSVSRRPWTSRPSHYFTIHSL